MASKANTPKRKTAGPTKVVVVAQQKGGVGKTTTSRILAEGTAISGYRGLCIDLDPQANFSARLVELDLTDGKRPPVHPLFDPNGDDDWSGRSSSADIFKGGAVLPYPTCVPNLDLIPADGEALRRVEYSLDPLAVRELLARPELQAAYDFVIIDTPPSQGLLTVAGMRAATHLVVPVVMEPQSLEGLHDMIGFWRRENRLREGDYIEMIGVLPNKVDVRTAIHMGYLELWRSDEALGPMMMPFELNQKIIHAELDAPNARYSSVFKLPRTNAARRDAERLRAYFIDQVFRRRTLAA